MRFRLKANMEGNVFLPTTEFDGPDGIRYEFLADLPGRLTHVAVSTRVDPTAFATSVSDGESDGVAMTITHRVRTDYS